MQMKLLRDPLLVRLHGLRTDEQAFADARGRVSLCYQNEDIALTLGERFVLQLLDGMLGPTHETSSEGASRGLLHVGLARCHRADGVDEIPVRATLDQV